MSTANILSIAGSDPSGGAGIQADLKTVTALGGYGMAVISALTAQNTVGVQAAVSVEPEFVEAQLVSVFSDIRVDAIKIGMIGSSAMVEVIAGVLKRYGADVPVILDPVMVATSGDRLVSQDTVDAMVHQLFPLAQLITPNIPEAEILLRAAVLDIHSAAEKLYAQLPGQAGILLKGGHDTRGDEVLDILADSDGSTEFSERRVESGTMHGTGCTLSSAIACCMGQGMTLSAAIVRARRYVVKSMEAADMLDVGSGGARPLHHGFCAAFGDGCDA